MGSTGLGELERSIVTTSTLAERLPTLPSDEGLRELDTLVRDLFARPEEGALREVFQARCLESTVQGALGFYLLVRAAERWNNAKSGSGHPDYDECVAHLGDSRVVAHMRALYGFGTEVPEAPAELTLHKVGTTSYLFRFRAHHAVRALKLIKPPYLGSPTVTEAIFLAASHSRPDFTYAPRFYGAPSRSYAVMDFIKGPTLRETLDLADGSPATVMDLAEFVIDRLCNHLQLLKNSGEAHRDLSPENVIIRNEFTEDRELWLVDFGVNHLLREVVGSAQLVSRAQHYIPREVLDGQDASPTADVYSIGVIVAEIVARAATAGVTAGGDPRPVSADGASALADDLELIRRTSPRLAAVIDPMVDGQEATRVHDIRATADLFSRLREKLLAGAADFRKSMSEAEIPLVFRVLFAIPTGSVSKYLDIASEAVQVFYRSRVRRPWVEISALASQLAYLTFWGAFISAVTWHLRQHTLWSPGVWPGLAVAFSYGLVATKYYQTIFAGLSARQISPVRENVLRWGSVFHTGPILITLLVEPRAWPFCYFAGLVYLTVNNWAACSLALRAGAYIRRSGIRPPQPHSFGPFLAHFSGWHLMSGVYAGAVLAVGLGLHHPFDGFGRLVDEPVYALVVMLVNAKMYFSNCTRQAPEMRAGLDWAFAAMTRAAAVSGDLVPAAVRAERR